MPAPYPARPARLRRILPVRRYTPSTPVSGIPYPMSDATTAVRNLRERLTGNSEDRLGKALSDLLDNPLLTGAIGRAFDAREKAAQAQELAMGALNIPSAADIERLTRRLRSVSNRLEGIEDGVERLDRAIAALTRTLDQAAMSAAGASAAAGSGRAASKPPGAKAKPPGAKARPAGAKAKAAGAKAKAA